MWLPAGVCYMYKSLGLRILLINNSTTTTTTLKKNNNNRRVDNHVVHLFQ